MTAPTRSFTISTCLGRGGFGEVYRAQMTRSQGLDTQVALKVLRRDIDPDGQAVQRLKDEARLLSRLNHPAILKVHDLIVLDGRTALITEFVDGDDLSQCIRGPRAMGRRALLQALAILAGALDAAWNSPAPDGEPLRMVHRDIKPSNVRVSRHGDVKLLDFGIARTDSQTVERESRTRTGMMVGSPAYMAPERFMERTVYLRSDVFSVAAMFFEGLTGQRFYGDLPMPMQVALAVDDTRFATHLSSRMEEVPEGPLHDLLQQALAYEHEARPDPASLARRLDALAEAEPGPTLATFCRQRVWCDDDTLQGELLGRTLTESLPGVARPPLAETVERPRPEPPTLERTRPEPGTLERPRAAEPVTSARWPWILLALVPLLAGALLVLLLVTGGLAALPWALSNDEDPILTRPLPTVQQPPVEAPPPTPSAEPAPETARSKPKPIVAPRVRPQPTAKPQPVRVPTPEPVVPPPRPAPPPPVAAPAPTATIRLTGGVVAVLKGHGQTHRLPGDIPAGTYRLHALFNGLDAIEVRQVDVVAGAPMTIDCSKAFSRCTVK